MASPTQCSRRVPANAVVSHWLHCQQISQHVIACFLSLTELPATSHDNRGEAADGSEASDSPTSAEIMTIEVNEQAEQQPAGDDAAAEQVFMCLQVSIVSFHAVAIAALSVMAGACTAHVCLTVLLGGPATLEYRGEILTSCPVGNLSSGVKES